MDDTLMGLVLLSACAGVVAIALTAIVAWWVNHIIERRETKDTLEHIWEPWENTVKCVSIYSLSGRMLNISSVTYRPATNSLAIYVDAEGAQHWKTMADIIKEDVDYQGEIKRTKEDT